MEFLAAASPAPSGWATVDGGVDLVDLHRTAPVRIQRETGIDRFLPQGDADAEHQLVRSHGPVAIAIPGTRTVRFAAGGIVGSAGAFRQGALQRSRFATALATGIRLATLVMTGQDGAETDGWRETDDLAGRGIPRRAEGAPGAIHVVGFLELVGVTMAAQDRRCWRGRRCGGDDWRGGACRRVAGAVGLVAHRASTERRARISLGSAALAVGAALGSVAKHVIGARRVVGADHAGRVATRRVGAIERGAEIAKLAGIDPSVPTECRARIRNPGVQALAAPIAPVDRAGVAIVGTGTIGRRLAIEWTAPVSAGAGLGLVAGSGGGPADAVRLLERTVEITTGTGVAVQVRQVALFGELRRPIATQIANRHLDEQPVRRRCCGSPLPCRYPVHKRDIA